MNALKLIKEATNIPPQVELSQNEREELIVRQEINQSPKRTFKMRKIMLNYNASFHSKSLQKQKTILKTLDWTELYFQAFKTKEIIDLFRILKDQTK